MMAALAGFIALLSKINDAVFWVGRQLSWMAIGLMVLIILAQVFARYVLNDALPWSEELARVLMLWLTGLMAPSAYRWGAFVAIDMLRDLLPRWPRAILTLCLFGISLTVLLVMAYYGWKHINSGWLFGSATLKIKLAWVYMALPVGFLLMISACIELIAKEIHEAVDPDVNYTSGDNAPEFVAE